MNNTTAIYHEINAIVYLKPYIPYMVAFILISAVAMYILWTRSLMKHLEFNP